jgi:hypothetical protein
MALAFMERGGSWNKEKQRTFPSTHITVSALFLGFQSWEVDEQCSL